MEQQKALSALEPFLALSKSASSPRAAADLITRATSAPSTFIFAELLSTPPIAALASSPDFAPHHTLLQIFSYGTYETYAATPGLPALDDAQALKLRQLSLLTLAKNRENLAYGRLRHSLALSSSGEVEKLVTTAVYAGLLSAALDPAREVVQVQSVAPLRDLAPGTVPRLLSSLQGWSARCGTTLADLDEQINAIRATAAAREAKRRTAEDKMDAAVKALADKEAAGGGPGTISGQRLAARGFGRGPEGEMMEVDESGTEEERRASKRKL